VRWRLRSRNALATAPRAFTCLSLACMIPRAGHRSEARSASLQISFANVADLSKCDRSAFSALTTAAGEWKFLAATEGRLQGSTAIVALWFGSVTGPSFRNRSGVPTKPAKPSGHFAGFAGDFPGLNENGGNGR
jgi:hypothetical protein